MTWREASACVLAALLATLMAAGGCSRKSESRSRGAEPFPTYRNAVKGADSAAAGEERRARGMDSIIGGGQ